MSKMVIYGLSLDGVNFRYIGMTTVGEERLRGHISVAKAPKPRAPVHKWIAKHGGDSIKFTIIETVKTQEELCAREVYWIAHMRMVGHKLFNIHPGGCGVHERTTDEESRRRMSVAKKDKPSNFTGKKHTQETKDKISRAKKGVPRTGSVLEAIRKSSPVALHVRWHVNRNMVNPNCVYCTNSVGVS